jgi:hypothetical protein
MITVTVGTGGQCESVSYADRSDALDCMACADCDVVVFDDGIPIAFRFVGTDEDSSRHPRRRDHRDTVKA